MNLKEHYIKNVMPEFKKKFGYKNDLAIPRLIKIVVNVGLNAGIRDDKIKTYIEESLKKITGQQPIATQARHSIAGFNIRKGMIIGNKVTLRGANMYDFIEKIIHAVLPRVRDFQGLERKSLDNDGNLTIGLRENTIFPEITPEGAASHGLEITCVTNARLKEEAFELFKLLKFPFKEYEPSS